MTFNSSITCDASFLSASDSVEERGFTSTLARGCLTRILALLRAARPRLDTRIAKRIPSDNSSSIKDSSAMGKLARCTLSGALWSKETTRLR